MITVESDSNWTLLTIVKYEVYQGERYTDEHTNEYTNEYTGETPTNTPTNTQTDTKQEYIKNDKNEKNEKNEKKSIYGEYAHVRLKESEYEKLVEDFGQEMTQACITFLDEYIEMKGYKAKSHYLCIRKWVVDAVKERKPKNKTTDSLEESYQMLKDWSEREWTNTFC